MTEAAYQVEKRTRRTKYVFLETFGCQMNESDSERILGFLGENDYVKTGLPEKADLILLNTCSIRDKAEHKVYSMLGRFKPLKDANPDLIIAVAGCVAQQKGAALLKKVAYLDLVFGPHNIHKIKDMLQAVENGTGRVVETSFSSEIDGSEYLHTSREGAKAFVSIMRGCDNFCTYCIVPYTRGREASRKSSDILSEIRALTLAGVKEVTLVGQNVNSYGVGVEREKSFPDLLRSVASIEDIERIRFVTSHPKDISESLISLFADERKVCRHLHLPVQSGSDQVLARMKRGYTIGEYKDKISRLRASCPGLTITTDIIVGFPGETDRDFEATMALVKSIRFDNIFSFAYSPRPGTKASDYEDRVPAGVSSARLQLLQEAQREITLEKNSELIGSIIAVMIEGKSKTNADRSVGRSMCNRLVSFPCAAHQPGDIIDVEVISASPNALRGFYRPRR